MEKARHNPNFSLIELLVVIAVIAMLCSLLLPALAKAKNTARTISCAGNGHQLMVAMTSYLGDFNDFFPAVKVGTVCWVEQLCPYFGMTYVSGAIPRSSVFGCPSQLVWNGSQARLSYGYNIRLFGWEDYLCQDSTIFHSHYPPIRANHIASPGDQLVFADAWLGYLSEAVRTNGYWRLDNPGTFGLRHQRRCNVVYMAGNVKAEDKAHTADAVPYYYPINATCQNLPYSYQPAIVITDYSPY